MSEAIKPTPGPWTAKGRDVFIGRLRVVHAANAASSTPMNMRDEVEQAHRNALFIAEAGTVFHETGLSPRQLAERNEELVEVVRELVAYDESDHEDSVGMMLDYSDMLKAARKALAKCQPKPQEVKP